MPISSSNSDDQRLAQLGIPAGTPAWITPTLLHATVRVWSRRAGISIDIEEAVSILQRVGTLIDALRQNPFARPRADR